MATFTAMQKFNGEEVDFFTKQIQCFNNGKLYKVTIVVPTISYNDVEEDRINEVIKSLRFSK